MVKANRIRNEIIAVLRKFDNHQLVVSDPNDLRAKLGVSGFKCNTLMDELRSMKYSGIVKVHRHPRGHRIVLRPAWR